MDNAAIRAAAEQQRAQVISFGREPAPPKQYVRLLKQKRATEQKKAAKAAEGEAAGAALPDAREAALRTKCALDPIHWMHAAREGGVKTMHKQWQVRRRQ